MPFIAIFTRQSLLVVLSISILQCCFTLQYLSDQSSIRLHHCHVRGEKCSFATLLPSPVLLPSQCVQTCCLPIINTYINSLITFVRDCMRCNYTDDGTIYVSGQRYPDIIRRLENDTPNIVN